MKKLVLICLLSGFSSRAFCAPATLEKSASLDVLAGKTLIGHRTYSPGTRVDAAPAENGKVRVTTEDGATGLLPADVVAFSSTPTPQPKALPPTPASSAPPVAGTADLKTLSGKTYKQARVFRPEPDGITYAFSGGMVKIPFSDLPQAIRQQYGYDPKSAAAFASQDAAAQQQLASEAQAQANNARRGEQAKADAQAADERAKAERARWAKEAVGVSGTVIQKLPKGGLILSCHGASDTGPVADSMASIGGGGGVAPSGGSFSQVDGPILLKGYPREAELADFDKLEIQAASVGLVKIGSSTYHAYQFVK